MSDPLTMLAELAAAVSTLQARVDDLEHRESSCRWLTIEQAAEYLGTTEKAIRRRCDRGRLPIVRDGRRLYIDRLVLDEAFAAQGSMLRSTKQKAPATVARPGARTQEVGLP
jgi:excisionase family DNA binding protein